MRIRSIKPEFYTSEDVARLDWQTRLVFIGVWSYVDDNGVGRDVEKLISASLFPLEDDPRDTLATVSRALAKLSEGGQIIRYTVDGAPFLYVEAWPKHQRIDKPAKPRYPLPTCGNAVIRDTLATLSRQSPETVAPGTGEQGNRGTGDTATRPESLTLPDAAETVGQRANRIAKVYTDRQPMSRFPAIAGIVRKAISAGKSDDEITDALTRLAAEGRPLTVESLRIEIEGLPPRTPPPRASTTDQRVQAALDLAAKYRDQEAQQLAIEETP